MSTANIPSDSLPSTVPKLDPTGSNWALFSIRFEEALSTHGRWGHFDGTDAKPVLSTPTAKPDEMEKLAEWEKEERMAQYMLSQKLPDSVVVQVHKLDTVKKKWDLVKEEYTRKGLFSQADLQKSFMQSQCPCGESIRHFLTDLGTR